MTVLSPFDEVIRDFAQAQHLPRIKKLLVYACTQQWESNPDCLAHYHLHTLIETLMQIAPTLDQLKTYLDQVTQSLSKSAEYLLIANAIVQSLRKLYVNANSAPDFNDNPHLYWQVAQTLEQDPEHLRMRKLMVLICRNHWEMDTNRLLAVNLPNLVYELHQLTQSMETLQAVFNSVVQNTSKPQQYGAIASRILAACQLLYTPPPSSSTELRVAAPGMGIAPPTTFHGAAKTSTSTQANPGGGNGANGQGRPVPPPLSQRPGVRQGGKRPTTPIGQSPQPRAAASPNAPEPAPSTQFHPVVSPSTQSLAQSPASPADSNHHSPSASKSPPDQIPTFTQGELFDLRLEIMKYAIPLLAKQILFLTLYAPVECNSDAEVAKLATDSETWAALKNRDLDDLIAGTLKQYPTLSMLEEGLQRSARLSQQQQRSAPVASAIARAVKTMTAKHYPGRITQESAADAQDRLRNPEQTRQVGLPTVSYDDASLPPPSSPSNPPPNASNPLNNGAPPLPPRKAPPRSSPSSAPLSNPTLRQDDTVING